MEDKSKVKKSTEWLESLTTASHQLEALTNKGLRIVRAQEGYLLCNFEVSENITDADGNWHVGAMTTVMDDICGAVIYSLVGHVKASVDFSISFFSTAKIQEEVEIEAKVVAEKGRLASVVIEVTRKSDGELIALGKQWMASHNNSKL